jgi:DNA-directed RNA polymerase
MMTQVEVEEKMYLDGRSRMLAKLDETEVKGRAGDAPYAGHVYRAFVQPLAEIIRKAVVSPEPGQGMAHVALLKPLDPDAVAYLAVRHALAALLTGEEQHHRGLGYALGRTVHRELVLERFEDLAPDLYHTLAKDFARRMSKSERHRMAVYAMQAKKAGLDLNAWGIGARDQVGLWLLGRLEGLGMVIIGPSLQRVNYKREYRVVTLAPEVRQTLVKIKDYLAETSPTLGPCVERPLPWNGNTGGGWHTPRMRKAHRYLVKAHASARPAVAAADLSIPCAAVNALQNTAWRVNKRVLEVVLAVAKTRHSLGEIETQVEPPKPERMPWMDAELPNGMTPEQEAQLRAWKRAMVSWYEEVKLRGTKFGRFYTATRQALMFKDYPELFFVYFLDSRGRAYPQTYGLNPQGSDLQKALLEFAEGKPLRTDSAVRWFLVHGANSWGFDSAPLPEREQWVRSNRDLILRVAADPENNLEWADADNPLQFLAWCLEFEQWMRDPHGFESRIPVALDGSCNGLQHFSAMLRDEIGGEATNLTPSDTKSDVYARVAEAAQADLEADPERSELGDRWLAHKINRSVTKRPVMTTPYGIKPRSAREYVVEDYLKPGKAPEFEPHEYWAAAGEAMKYIHPAIGKVVVKSREAMNWLSAAGKLVSDRLAQVADDPVLTWVTPSGFVASQAYFDVQVHRIRTHLNGTVRIRVLSENDSPDCRQHAQGMAPNFVHSMDAAHMHLTTARLAAEGVRSLAMVHDSFATHAADTDRMARVLREEFVAMYRNHNPLEDFRARFLELGDLPPVPAMGTLNLEGVLDSEFFFS